MLPNKTLRKTLAPGAPSSGIWARLQVPPGPGWLASQTMRTRLPSSSARAVWNSPNRPGEACSVPYSHRRRCGAAASPAVARSSGEAGSEARYAFRYLPLRALYKRSGRLGAACSAAYCRSPCTSAAGSPVLTASLASLLGEAKAHLGSHVRHAWLAGSAGRRRSAWRTSSTQAKIVPMACVPRQRALRRAAGKRVPSQAWDERPERSNAARPACFTHTGRGACSTL